MATGTSPEEDVDDLLDEVVRPAKNKAGAVAKKRSAKNKKAVAAAAKRAEADALRAADQAAAQQLAQIVNLTIAGHSYADIGASIGKTADEVEQMLVRDAGRYVRTQPALRTYVRNFLSEKYSGLLEATYDQAIDKNHPDQLDYSAQSLRILKEMGRLHGAEAPTQSEVKVEAAPEQVEALVAALAQGKGIAYDMDVFDAEIVEDIHEADVRELEAASDAVEMEGDDDRL